MNVYNQRFVICKILRDARLKQINTIIIGILKDNGLFSFNQINLVPIRKVNIIYYYYSVIHCFKYSINNEGRQRQGNYNHVIHLLNTFNYFNSRTRVYYLNNICDQRIYTECTIHIHPASVLKADKGCKVSRTNYTYVYISQHKQYICCFQLDHKCTDSISRLCQPRLSDNLHRSNS